MARPDQSQLPTNGLDHEALTQDVADVIAAQSAWRSRRGPLYQRLADALREAILNGDLAPARRLPAERQLAEQLSISRSTVVAAYGLLDQAELVERRQGSGTRVRYSPPPRQVAAPGNGVTRALSRNTLFRRITEGSDETIDLVGAYLLNAGGLPPEVLAGVEREIAGLSRSSGYAPLGYPPLRLAIAEHLSRRGLPTVPEQVLVTSGAQQALHLVAMLLVQPGDTVIVENPTYPGALDAFLLGGARLAWIPTGRRGADLEALADLAARLDPRLVYLIPTYHNPVGGLMPEHRRRMMARLVEERQLATIEDESLASLGLHRSEAPPPVASFCRQPGAPVFTVDSLSKVGWGGLRVGWVRAPEELIERLGRLKAVADLGGSLPGQVIATRLVESYDEVLLVQRRVLAERFELMSDLLARCVPAWSWEPPQGGLCLWVRLPHGNATEFAQLALRHGVSVVAGPVASADGSFGDYLRLPFGHEPAALEEGVCRLAAAWNAYLPRQEASRQTLSVIV